MVVAATMHCASGLGYVVWQLLNWRQLREIRLFTKMVAKWHFLLELQFLANIVKLRLLHDLCKLVNNWVGLA